MLKCIEPMSGALPDGYQIISWLQAMGRLLKNTKQDMDAARKLLTQAKVDLQRMLETASLADPTAPGFLPKINSNRMGPAPPRPVQLLSPELSWRHFQKLVEELLLACDVVKVKAISSEG